MLSAPVPTAFYILRVMGDHPDLGARGWRFTSRDSRNDGEMFRRDRALMEREEFEHQVDTAIAYLRTRGISRCDGSYGLKHKAERFGAERGLARYVSNGAVICAALILGHSVLRDINSPNCRFVPRSSRN